MIDVIFLVSWNGYDDGQRVSLPTAEANRLIAANICVLDSAVPSQPTGPGAVPGAGILEVADFAALLALPSPVAGQRARTAAAVLTGGATYLRWVYRGAKWTLDGDQLLLADLTPSVGIASTNNQILKSLSFPVGLLNALATLKLQVLFAKDGTTDAATHIRLNLGAAGSAADPIIATTAGFSAGNRAFVIEQSRSLVASTTSRLLGQFTTVNALGAPGAVPYPQDVTIPDVTSAVCILTAQVQMAGTTNIPTVANLIIGGQ